MGAKRITQSSQDSQDNCSPAFSREEQENNCIALSYNLVEKRLREGTATSQETCFFLKLGSTNERREREKLEEEIKLLRAKTAGLEAAKASDEKYTKAILAMKKYSGHEDDAIDVNLYEDD